MKKLHSSNNAVSEKFIKRSISGRIADKIVGLLM